MPVLGPGLREVLAPFFHMPQRIVRTCVRRTGFEPPRAFLGIPRPRLIQALLNVLQIRLVSGWQGVEVEQFHVIAAGVVVTADEPGVLRNAYAGVGNLEHNASAPGSARRLGGEELPAAGAVAALVGARLRVLRAACGAMLVGVALLAAASVMVVRLRVVRPVASTGLSLTLTAVAAVLILAGSRVQAAILARAGRGTGERRSDGGSGAVASGTAQLPGAAAAVVGAWAWATVAGFASFVAVAALGLVVAAVTAVARYALVICGVAALGMAARWPRRAAVLGLLRRRGLA